MTTTRTMMMMTKTKESSSFFFVFVFVFFFTRRTQIYGDCVNIPAERGRKQNRNKYLLGLSFFLLRRCVFKN